MQKVIRDCSFTVIMLLIVNQLRSLCDLRIGQPAPSYQRNLLNSNLLTLNRWGKLKYSGTQISS